LEIVGGLPAFEVGSESSPRWLEQLEESLLAKQAVLGKNSLPPIITACSVVEAPAGDPLAIDFVIRVDVVNGSVARGVLQDADRVLIGSLGHAGVEIAFHGFLVLFLNSRVEVLRMGRLDLDLAVIVGGPKNRIASALGNSLDPGIDSYACPR
jgi:hypothetical protein